MTLKTSTPENLFLDHSRVEKPIIAGPMYPCSNPELVAAVSNSGGLGIIQPISLTFVHKYELRQGIKFIRTLTSKPIGFNVLIEKSSSRYQQKMQEWVDIALEEEIRFFITSLGNPKWVVDRVTPLGGIVYHDVTEKKWADKGLDSGAKGLIAVNNRAGGHAGHLSAKKLFEELSSLKVPLICAGGIAGRTDYLNALGLGYQGVQMGTRFIATEECSASTVYKNAIVTAKEEDIVLSEKITGVPVSVIKTPFIEAMGYKAGRLTKYLLSKKKTKHWVRTFYAVMSLFKFRKSLFDETGKKEFWQAGKSVDKIDEILSVREVFNEIGE